MVGVLALIVFGPDKLPEIARTVGGFMKQLRTMADDVKQEFSDSFEVDDEPDDEEVAALAADDSEVARLDEGGVAEPASPAEPESPAEPDPGARDPGAARSSEGRSEHPVAEAIKAEREAPARPEGP